MEQDIGRLETLTARTAWEAGLKPGDPVRVFWGYGSGFRAEGPGVIDSVYAKSFRVRLTADVRHGDSVGWPEGFILKGIPRFIAYDRWHPENAVWPHDIEH